MESDFYKMRNDLNNKKDALFKKGDFKNWDLGSIAIGNCDLSMQDIIQNRPYFFKFLLPKV